MNRIYFFFILILVLSTRLPAAESTQSQELLPANPSMWLNSTPLSAESLKGKGVVLWFFEEDCPKCRGQWPAMYELANKHKGEPVVFIAVNSGNPAPVVAQYAKEVKLNWPIIVDPTRQFEKQWMENQISLQNIYQCELLLPSGEKGNGRWNDLEGSVQQALNGASWKIDPKTIPTAFIPTWQQVELGNYAAAANLLKKGLVTKNAEVKEAATRVKAYVDEQMESALADAAKAREGGDEWRAYQLYRGVTTTFAGYDLPSAVPSALKELADNSTVKKELEAAKLLEAIKKSFATARTDAGLKRIATRLEQLVAQHGDTEAAAEARQFLDQAK